MATTDDVERLMMRCQIGFSGRDALYDANNLLAECYGALGALVQERDPHTWLTDQAVPIDQADFDDANEVMFGRERGSCSSGLCFV